MGFERAWLLACLLMVGAAVSGAEEGSLRFKPAGPGEFNFDTGILRGKLREAGASKGLSQVIHVPTGTRLDSSMGLFSHYRVFTQGRRYGVGAWDWPSQATLEPDGSVSVRWPASADRPFEFGARYRWVTPNALELETSVKAQTNLVKFESFLASYFSAGFTNSLVSSGSADTFTPARKDAGAWQAFPRDEDAGAVIKDGRWKLEPNPVDWVLQSKFSKSLALRRASADHLTAVVMADSRECFAICTPQETDGHYSTYLSLFGRDLKAGELATVRTRLAIIASVDDKDALAAYAEFTKFVPKSRE